MTASRFSLGRWVSVLLMSAVLWQWGQAGWIMAKAWLAQWLIAEAWQQSLEQGPPQKPWPWADTWPVGRLQFPTSGSDLYILAGVQGNSLAFGPGHNLETATPGEGPSVIGGHRDTHFAVLRHVFPGDHLHLQNHQGDWRSYRVYRREVVDSSKQPLRLPETGTPLILVTCYPFDQLAAGGPLRLLIYADASDDASNTTQSPPPMAL